MKCLLFLLILFETELLNDIIEKCTVPNVFHQKQTLEIIDYVKEKYDNPLEFLWDQYAGDAIYRNPQNKKWYAALLTTTKNKFFSFSFCHLEVL